MWNDPIIEEIHAVRRELAAECNNDLKAIVQRQQRHAHRLSPAMDDLPLQAKTQQNNSPASMPGN